MDFKQVGVIGGGTMGSGIVEVLARGGYSVVGVDVDEAGLARAKAHLDASTARAFSRGKLSQLERGSLLARGTLSPDPGALAEADLVIEAVTEDLDLKRRVFTDLDRITKPDAVLATNTSSLSVTEISVATLHPRRVVGLHFFNPAPVLGFVEVVRTLVTDAEV